MLILKIIRSQPYYFPLFGRVYVLLVWQEILK